MKKGPTLFVKIFAPGLGDLVVLSPILYNLKEKRIVDKLNLIVLTESQKQLAERMYWIDNTYLDGEKFPVDKYDFFVDMAKHPLEKDLWWGSNEYIERFGKKHVTYVMNEIVGGCGLPDKIPTFRVEDISKKDQKFYNQTVLIAPGGRRKIKQVKTETWEELIRELNSRGYHACIIGNRHHKGSEQVKELRDKGYLTIETGHLGRLIDIIYHSAGLIGIDSGLYHIASIMNKPTVGVFGAMPSWLWGGLGKKTVNIEREAPVNLTTASLDWEFMNGGNPLTDDITAEELIYSFELAMEKGENGE